MLDGLEATELKLSEVSKDNDVFRIDSEYFKKDYLQVVNSEKPLALLSDLVEAGYRVVYENTEVIDPEIAQQLDYPIFLQATDIETPFINTEALCYVAESEWQRYTKGRIKHGELLIEVKGKAEKVAIVPDNFPEKVLVSGSLYKLTPNDKINKYFLLTYLVSKYGQAFKERAKSNLLVSFVSKNDLYKIPVPLPSNSFQVSIEQLFKVSSQRWEQSKGLYAEAEHLLLDTLGLKDWQPTEEQIAVKSFAESYGATKRLDAEYYQPKYEQALDKLKELKPKRVVPLEQLLSFITNGHTPRYHDLTIGEVPFLTAEHVSDFRINFNSEKRIRIVHHDVELARTQLQQGDLLITIKGRIGNAAIVEHMPTKANINQDVALLRLNSDVPPYFVAGYLNSAIGKSLIHRISTGQINPFLGLGNLRTIPVPIFDEEIMNAIDKRLRDTIESAYSTGQESKRLLENAKRAVEIAIEQDEATATAWLKEKQ